MKTRMTAAIAVLLAVAGSACQDNWQSFFINDNKIPGDPPSCTIPSDETAEGLWGGVMDITMSYSYHSYLFVSNALMSREDYGLPRAESNGIFVQGIYLWFEPDPEVRQDYQPVEYRLTAFVGAQGTGTIGTPLIPYERGVEMADAMRAASRSSMTVLVTAQFYGITQSGIDVLSQEFRYPIEICDGCLRICPQDAIPTTPLVCDCPAGATGDLPCFPGQDFPVDICLL